MISDAVIPSRDLVMRFESEFEFAVQCHMIPLERFTGPGDRQFILCWRELNRGRDSFEVQVWAAARLEEADEPCDATLSIVRRATAQPPFQGLSKDERLSFLVGYARKLVIEETWGKRNPGKVEKTIGTQDTANFMPWLKAGRLEVPEPDGGWLKWERQRVEKGILKELLVAPQTSQGLIDTIWCQNALFDQCINRFVRLGYIQSSAATGPYEVTPIGERIAVTEYGL